MNTPVHESPVLFSTLDTASGHRFGRATLNAPSALNALSAEMIGLLGPQVDAWADDPDIAGVILDASGPKAFCAGGDVVSLYRTIRARQDAGTPGAPPEAAWFFEHEYRLDHRLHTYPKPVLCWGHGIVMGGGIGLMAGASHRVATAETRLAMPEITIGLYPDVGGSAFLHWAPEPIGLFLALSGVPINAADAVYARLADVIVPQARKDEVLAAIGAARWGGEGAEDRARLSAILDAHAMPAAEQPESPVRAHAARIAEVVGDGALATIDHRLRALKDDADPWLSRAGKTYAEGSPTSAALAFELHRRAASMTLADVFRLEFDASVACCAGREFPEGVRALLVDKDRQPRWDPPTLAEVAPERIAALLARQTPDPHPLADLD